MLSCNWSRICNSRNVIEIHSTLWSSKNINSRNNMCLNGTFATRRIARNVCTQTQEIRWFRFISLGILVLQQQVIHNSKSHFPLNRYFGILWNLAVFGTHIVLCVNEHFIARLIVFFSPRAVFRSSSLFLSVYPATVRVRQYCAADSIEWTNRNEIVDCGVSIVYQRDGLRNNQMSEYRFFSAPPGCF